MAATVPRWHLLCSSSSPGLIQNLLYRTLSLSRFNPASNSNSNRNIQTKIRSENKNTTKIRSENKNTTKASKVFGSIPLIKNLTFTSTLGVEGTAKQRLKDWKVFKSWMKEMNRHYESEEEMMWVDKEKKMDPPTTSGLNGFADYNRNEIPICRRRGRRVSSALVLPTPSKGRWSRDK